MAVYRALLEIQKVDTGELSRQLGYSPDEVSDALGNLKRLALVRPSWTDPDSLRPVPPEVGLRALLADREAELHEQHRAVDQARGVVEIFATEYADWRAGRGGDETEFVEDQDDAWDRLEELVTSAQTEILSFNSGPYRPDVLETFLAVETSALERGVALRTVYLDSAANTPMVRRCARWLSERGAQLRTNPVLPTRMTILDRKVAFLPLDSPTSDGGVVILLWPSVLAVLIEHFEQIWESAAPFGYQVDEAEEDTEAPSAAERAALKMLAEGLTDEAVARRLAVSLRTVRRMTARLMKALGTRSRFEAGVRAARRGWV
jgi:DNA-binding CsgD family transcriptional regulator/sugar-specific transcriptional regulator TrmB